MPVSSTIPLTAGFLQTAVTYPSLTELIAHPTNGYLYGCYNEGGVGKIIKIKNDDYTDVTVANLPVAVPIDMFYSSTNDKFYVVYRTTNSPVTEVHPTTLVMSSFFSITSVGGQGAITGDASNLYVATFSTQKLYSVSLATGLQVGVRTMPPTGYAKINCLRCFGTKLFALSMEIDYVQLSRIAPANLGTEEVSEPIGIDAGEVPVDDIGESSNYVYVGNRDLLGIIRKFSKTDFLNPELIATTQLSKCTCVKTVGSHVWAAYENGRGIRINPENIPDRRIYTLNDGQGYHSEFTGGNEFVHTYNLSTSKLQRYQIPSDVVSGAINWLSQTGSTGSAPPAALVKLSDGSVVVGGIFYNAVDFGNGVTLTSLAVADGYVAKYDSAGVAQWARRIGGLSTPEATVALAVDGSDNIIALGNFTSSSIKIGVEERVVNNTGTTQDCWMAKFTSAGACTWARGFGSAPLDTAASVALDSDGDIFVAAGFGNNVNFGNGVTLTVTGFMNLVKFQGSDGVALWAINQNVGTARAVAIDSNDDAVVAGDLYVKKFSGVNGALSWTSPTSGVGSCKGVVVTSAAAGGDIIVCGTANSGADFGGGAISAKESFIAGYSSSGAYRWHQTIGGGTDTANAIGISSDDIFAVTGYVVGSPNISFFVTVYTSNGATLPTRRWGIVATGAVSAGYSVKVDTDSVFIAAEACNGTSNFGGRTATGSGSLGFGAGVFVNYVRGDY